MKIRLATFIATCVFLLGSLYAVISATVLFHRPEGAEVDFSEGRAHIYFVALAAASSTCIAISYFLHRGRGWAFRVAAIAVAALACSLLGVYWWTWSAVSHRVDFVTLVCDRLFAFFFFAGLLSHSSVIRLVESEATQRSNQAIQTCG